MKESSEIFKPKPKLYGEQAERIHRAEYEKIVSELIDKLGAGFKRIKPTEQLDDKESFGDIDIVCLPERTIDRLYFEKIIGHMLLDYKLVGHVHSLLVRLGSGKQVQVDLIQSKGEADFERKYMYYSKGHLSSILGVTAKKFHFKYGTEGFFKRLKDKRGNWHDILISEDLRDGLTVLGFDPKKYSEIKTMDDIASYIPQSPFFDSSYYQFDSLLRRDREAADRNPREKHIIEKLSSKSKKREAEDEDKFFKQFFPEAFERFRVEAERINKETYVAGNINGEKVMEIFGITPGPTVGKVLKFIGDNYPEAEELSAEMIEAIKINFLK